MVEAAPARLDAAAFDAIVAHPIHREHNLELIDGELIEKMVSSPTSSIIALRIGRLIGAYVDENRLGAVTGADGGYWIGADRYIPDVAFISRAKLAADVREGYRTTAPDLAVEVISATDLRRDITAKVANYLAAGTVVWLVDPDEQSVQVFEPGKPVTTFTRAMSLTGGAVMPGLAVDLAQVFQENDPSPRQLSP
jgi:Uma2 family endonuclease